MIIGDGAHKLERRINATMNGTTLTAKELNFLEAILHRIERYRDQAFITDAQASWLYTILTRDESDASRSNFRPPKPGRSSYAQTFRGNLRRVSSAASASLAHVKCEEDERPQGFDITEALVRE